MKIELESTEGDGTITVDGVIISLELLRHLANPDELKFYQFHRSGDVVTVKAFRLASISAASEIAGSQAN